MYHPNTFLFAQESFRLDAKVFANNEEYSDVPGQLTVPTEARDGKEIDGETIKNSDDIEFTYAYR